MIFKDGEKYFEMQFDASSFVAYMASLGFDFSFQKGVVEFPDRNLLDAILVGVMLFGKSGSEQPNKNLVFLMTIYMNQNGLLEKRGMEMQEEYNRRNRIF